MNIFDFLIHFNVLVFSLFSALLPGHSNYYELIYGAPWCRFVPYGVGMILGAYLHNHRGKTIKVNPVSLGLDIKPIVN